MIQTRATQRVLTVLALAIGACGEPTASPSGTVIQGTAVLAADAPATIPAARLSLALTSSNGPAQVVSTSLTPDGRFTLGVPAAFVLSTDISATIDAPGNNDILPVLLTGPFDSVRHALVRPLLVPRAVHIVAGTFAGNTHEMSLFRAFQLPCTNVTSENCDSFFPQRWLAHVTLWPEAALPVPLAFDRVSSRGSINAEDSVALWHSIEKLHADLGVAVFRPATLPRDVTPDTSGYVRGYVTVALDSLLIGADGEANWIWNDADEITAAKLRFPHNDAFSNTWLVAHELYHALGFSHTCAWPSIMGGHGCAFVYSPTIDDVAGFTLAYAVRRAITRAAPTTTLGDARRGETQVAQRMLIAASRESGKR